MITGKFDKSPGNCSFLYILIAWLMLSCINLDHDAWPITFTCNTIGRFYFGGDGEVQVEVRRL